MKPSAILALAAAGAAAAATLFGCRSAGPVQFRGGPSAHRRAERERGPCAKAHGGTDNVNDAAFDAMFLKDYGVNPFVDADEDPLSTFAVDVDTGSYTLCRSYLERGHLPDEAAVRVEEFVNYFDYGYDGPDEDAFAIHLEGAPSKFANAKTLLAIGLKARAECPEQRKPAVLTFVVDVSGSMAREDRLELVKKSLRLLVGELREGDRVGIAVYGSRGRRLLDHCGIDKREDILRALEGLRPEGATNAEEGLLVGYRMAREALRPGAVNRVILCSDGVANVGRTGPDSILQTVEADARQGILLSTIGFGMGNYNDILMEQLADKGNGRYAYVDRLDEARRAFVHGLTGTLQVVARQAKVQVEFHPAVVRSYRLLGYENRDLADRDFRNDQVDGGEVGAGHAVTALYELRLWAGKAGPLATVRVRHKDPDGDAVRETSRSIAADALAQRFEDASPRFQLATCVAEFAEILRASYWARGSRLDDVLPVAESCRDRLGRREDLQELVSLIQKARDLKRSAE
jgi:Ca-activated chloride channel family protein